jgi:hypothetical protein
MATIRKWGMNVETYNEKSARRFFKLGHIRERCLAKVRASTHFPARSLKKTMSQA